MVSVGEIFYFDGADGTHRCSLWKSDGTGSGTMQVKDIDIRSPYGWQSRMAPMGGELYFTAYDRTHGEELWKSDGTAAGTAMVKDIGPGEEYGHLGPLVVVGDTLYFGANDGSRVGDHGSELWKSDGTEAGTVLVKDINPGTTNSNPSGLTAVGDSLYFIADDGTHGAELWKSDSTDIGTVMVKDIIPGPPDATSAAIPELTTLGDTLYFAADDGSHGVELWRSDGTEAGTERVASTGPAPDPAIEVTDPTDLTPVGGALYFAGTGTDGVELWRSDGTAAGTVRVSDINPGSDGSYPSQLTVAGDTLFFRAQDSVHGAELWSSNGTTAGTVLVKDIYPGISYALSNYGMPNNGWPDQLTGWGNAVYFRASETTHGTELWRTDGTDAGTVMVKDINPGALGSDPSGMTIIGSRLYFGAGGSSGPEPWTSNGTDLGTVRLIDATTKPEPVGTAPQAPTDVVATPGEHRTVTVTWDPPSDDGGLGITSYTVTDSLGGTATTTPGDSGGSWTGRYADIADDLPLTFTVTAVNVAGASAASEASAPVLVPATEPDQPPYVSIARHGVGGLRFVWGAPWHSGGYPVTGYTVHREPGNVALELGPTARDVVYSDLTSGTPYTFTVAVTNQIGTSAPMSSAPLAPAGQPAVVTGVGATRGDRAATVRWTPVDTNGGMLFGYTVTAQPGGVVARANADQNSAVVSGLANGTSYTFTVTATTDVGESLPSEPTTAVVPAGTPPRVTGVAATPRDGAAVVAWASADGNGAPVTGYTVTATPGGRRVNVPAAATRTVVTGLTNGIRYNLTVITHTAVGDSAPSSAAWAIPAGRPGVVGLPRIRVRKRTVTLTWIAASPNGSPITAYRISRARARTVSVDGTKTKLVLRHLRRGRQRIRVTAVNDVGLGPASGVLRFRIR
jgi:ELWxxDGT repeat protein